MISGPRTKFECRLRQRGYTLDEVRGCIVSEDGDTITVDETHGSYPRHPKPDRLVPGMVRDTPPPPAPPSSGPGTELKGMLRRWLGIVATPSCPCNAHARQMDAWGPDECERRLNEIVGWLEEEASRRRLPFVRAIAKKVVRMAVGRARKAAAT